MARACPACGRPNRDDAAKCLYCIAPLTPVATPPAATAAAAAVPVPSLPPSSVPPPGSDRHLMILLPGDTAEPRSVKDLARIAGLSEYDARLALSARRPRLFRRLSTEEEARLLSQELAEARVPHYVVSEASVAALPVAKASRGDISDHRLRWWVEGSAGSVVDMTVADVLLLVAGEITRERHHEKRMASTRGATRRLTSGLRLHVYERDARLALEIDPDTFDFAILGPDETASAHLNFQRLVSRFKELAPAIEVDRGFDLEPVVVARAAGGGDVTDALARGETGPEGVVYDNEGAFRFYARWRYRLERHLFHSR